MSCGPRVLIIVFFSILSLVFSVGLHLSPLPQVKLLIKTWGCSVRVLVNKVLISSTLVFISLSLLVNIILTALIPSRLIYRQRHFRNALGEEHGSRYINTITMCRIFGTDCHFQWRRHGPGIHAAASTCVWGADLLPTSPSYLRRYVVWTILMTDACLILLRLPSYLATLYCLSRSHGSCCNSNFKAIGASECQIRFKMPLSSQGEDMWYRDFLIPWLPPPESAALTCHLSSKIRILPH